MGIFEFFKMHSKGAALDFLRAFLGIALIGKGLYFIFHLPELEQMVGQTLSLSYINFILSHYIVFAHIAGGACIAIGLFTRIASIANLPILMGAVFFIHFSENFALGAKGISSGTEVSIMVLFSLFVFSFFGSGKLSADNYLKNHNPEEEEIKMLENRLKDENQKRVS